jgi:hypothetical protein
MNSSITREARGQKRNMLHETRESDAALLVSISRRAKMGIGLSQLRSPT